MSSITCAQFKPTIKYKVVSKKSTPSVRGPMLKPVERPNDYLSVAERVNGRAAMIGFT